MRIQTHHLHECAILIYERVEYTLLAANRGIKMLSRSGSVKAITLCDNSLTICAVDRSTIRRALALKGSDFEDNVVIACAERENLDAIITRNRHDFQYSSVPAYTPADYLHLQQVAEAESE